MSCAMRCAPSQSPRPSVQSARSAGVRPAGAWVHAYLHRKEGDLANADYWYRRAGQPACDGPLDDEWAAIVETLLEKH